MVRLILSLSLSRYFPFLTFQPVRISRLAIDLVGVFRVGPALALWAWVLPGVSTVGLAVVGCLVGVGGKLELALRENYFHIFDFSLEVLLHHLVYNLPAGSAFTPPPSSTILILLIRPTLRYYGPFFTDILCFSSALRICGPSCQLAFAT